jgi:hypothetical protein
MAELTSVRPGLDWSVGGLELEASPTCSELAAFTTWGEDPAWYLSWNPESTELPPATATLAEIPREDEPLVTLADVVSYERATAELVIAGGRLRDTNPRSARRPAQFLVHSERAVLLPGLFWSASLNSIPPQGTAVILYEQLIDDRLGTVRFQTYPERAVARPPEWPAGLHDAPLAAARKLLDAQCLSSCGCAPDRACREGVCQAAPTCQSAEDCCLGQCNAGRCQPN